MTHANGAPPRRPEGPERVGPHAAPETRSPGLGRAGWLAIAAGPTAWLLGWALGWAPALVEAVWGARISRWFAMAVGAATGLVPFSVAEVGGAVVLVGLGALSARRVGTVLRGPARVGALARAVARAAVRALAVVSVGYAVFLLAWGIGARRTPLGETLALPVVASSVEELAALYAEIVATTNGLRAPMPEVGGVAVPLGDRAEVLRRAGEVFARAAARWPLLGGRFAPPKPVIASRALSAVGILGIYIPFTGEANVSVDGPAFTLAFSASHEMAHQRGYTREDEANFIAFLVGRDAEPLDFRYAASFMAQVYTAAALGSVDPERWLALRRSVAPGVLRDAEAYVTWARGSRTRAADVAEAVNDTYLRSQGARGVQSYGEVVDLLLAERRKRLAAEAAGR